MAPADHQRVVLVQALATHVQALVAMPDELRESTMDTSRFHDGWVLCTTCSCTNEQESARLLATVRTGRPRPCPIANRLRASRCGQLGMDTQLPGPLSESAEEFRLGR
jgi:hypothetical protein